MQPCTVSSLLTKQEYTRSLFRQIYRNPYYIIITILGVVIAGLKIAILILGGEYDGVNISLGLFLILVPLLAGYITRRAALNNQWFQFSIDYTFSDDGIRIKGLTFESSIAWLHVVKIKDDNEFLLLHTSKTAGYLIKKDTLTQAQIDYIKSKVKNKGKQNNI
ncbi:MAG TPA: YcxB family protein [Chitinophagaceae bacterium]|nr:YcxB family protein [Chitinophagaceae bacterium]